MKKNTAPPTTPTAQIISNLPHTSSVRNIRTSRSSRSNRLALEITKERGIRSPQRPRTPKRIQLTRMPQRPTTSRIRARTRRAEEPPAIRQQRRLHVLKHIPLRHHHPTSAIIKRVARVGVEVVVDSVQQRVAVHLGRAARGVVDVVTLHGDEVLGARQVDAPVVVVVARGGPGGGAVELGVGERDAAGGAGAGDEHLAAD